MGQILDGREKFHKKQTDRLVGALNSLYKDAGSIWQEFSDLAQRDINKAIKVLPEFISKARDINPGGRAYESMAGGPNHDWIVPLINVLGDVYDDLNEENRKTILEGCLNYLDGLRYDNSQSHIEQMTSPTLVADIISNRGLYWCGLDHAKYWIKEQLKSPVSKERLDSFWVALAVIWTSDITTLPLREWYYREFPNAVEKAIKYIAIRFSQAAKETAETNKTSFEVELNKYLNKCFDPRFHDRIREKTKVCDPLMLS